MWLVASTAVFCFGLPYVTLRGVLVCTAVHLGSRGNYAGITDKVSLAGKPLVFRGLVHGEQPWLQEHPYTFTPTDLA